MVERNLAKVEVESSRLFSRSIFEKGSLGFPFFLVVRGVLFSNSGPDQRYDRALRACAARVTLQRRYALSSRRPDGEIGRHCGLKICFVKSFLLELPSQKVNSDNGLRASEL